MRGLAPADEYFGRFNISILGVTNTLRDAGNRIDGGAEPRAIVNGPLYFATDALRDWERKYPTDPWIAKDLLALESVYLRLPGDQGFRLATQTQAWLDADFPSSSAAVSGRKQLAAATTVPPAVAPAMVPVVVPAAPVVSQATPAPAPVSAWERFAALRAPLPSR